MPRDYSGLLARSICLLVKGRHVTEEAAKNAGLSESRTFV